MKPAFLNIALSAFAAAVILTACDAPAVEQSSREVAKQVIRPIVAARLPGLPTDIVVDCTIDNATAPEIITLAQTTLTGDSAAATQTVTEIIARPGTVQCMAENSAQQLLGGNLAGLLNQ